MVCVQVCDHLETSVQRYDLPFYMFFKNPNSDASGKGKATSEAALTRSVALQLRLRIPPKLRGSHFL